MQQITFLRLRAIELRAHVVCYVSVRLSIYLNLTLVHGAGGQSLQIYLVQIHPTQNPTELGM
jgi:hypothetical protein